MAPPNWTEKQWMFLVSGMAAIIIFFCGMFADNVILGDKVEANQASVIANTTEIEHIKEIFEEHLGRIDETIKSYDTKMATFVSDISSIKTYIETTKN